MCCRKGCDRRGESRCQHYAEGFEVFVTINYQSVGAWVGMAGTQGPINAWYADRLTQLTFVRISTSTCSKSRQGIDRRREGRKQRASALPLPEVCAMPREAYPVFSFLAAKPLSLRRSDRATQLGDLRRQNSPSPDRTRRPKGKRAEGHCGRPSAQRRTRNAPRG
jgi:hypothetical protein